jgi:tetratricopeptide (TPR) repeat protein
MMKKTKAPCSLAAVALVLLPCVASASGSGSMPAPAQRQQATPEQEAVELYNDGISYRDKAAQLDKEAAAEPDAKKKAKLEEKALDRTESSAKKFTQATKKNPRLFQGWGSLGFAYRRMGKFAESLEAYNKALEIEPRYTPAIEYRAETFLGLGRLDDVQSAYMILFGVDRPRADELSAAIDKWLQKKQADPAPLDPTAVESFAKWVAERKQLASQTSSLLAPAHEGW